MRHTGSREKGINQDARSVAKSTLGYISLVDFSRHDEKPREISAI